ncbi:MAG: methyl-accepting chemotaxis protein, partial [Alkalispirochaetaceae bacterium]
GETLNSGAGESERATGRIGETLVTVGEVMNAQREQAAEADQAMKNLTSLVGTVAAETRAAGDRAKQMATAAQSGRKAIESTREASDRLTESARATQSLINDLADRSREIRSITGSIEDIAAQTHLLAMNASIEAARAGEAGAGFSVVAHEIRNLSEESGRATERITTLLEEIINSMSEAAERSNQEITIIQSSNEEVSEAEAELESIDRSASTNTEKMEDVLGSLSAMEANAQKVAETISDLHRSNEEHLEQFELVREESSRLNRQVAAVARTAKELLAMAQSQRSLIASLELEEE